MTIKDIADTVESYTSVNLISMAKDELMFDGFAIELYSKPIILDRVVRLIKVRDNSLIIFI